MFRNYKNFGSGYEIMLRNAKRSKTNSGATLRNHGNVG